MGNSEQELMKRLAVVHAEAAKNETILRRAQDRELTLLKSASLQDLFHNLVTGLKNSFGLDCATVALSDPQHEIRHLLLFDNIENAEPEGVIFCDDMAHLSPIFEHPKGPVLGPFVSDLHARLLTSETVLASTAVLPLRREKDVIGSLNFGSVDEKRFTRYHATDFLDHLSVIAGFCLENNINRSKLIWTGLTDVLTGWHNRRYLEARLPEEFASAARNGETLTMLLFDLDHFKLVNDTHGHSAGDQVLRKVAKRVQREIRVSDVAARYGGEEFIVLLPRTSLIAGVALAERIRDAVCASPVRINEQTAVTMTVSIGAAALTPKTDQKDVASAIQQLIDQADQAMYAAKRGGRNQVSLVTPR